MLFRSEYFLTQMRQRVTKEFREKEERKAAEAEASQKIYSNKELEALAGAELVRESGSYRTETVRGKESHGAEALQESGSGGSGEKREGKPAVQGDVKSEPEQLELFDRKLLNPETKSEIKIIGQLFETYWLVQFEDKFYMIDQHAAHEKVLYERTVKSLENKELTSQMVSPPLILTLTMQEAGRLDEYLNYFTEMGFVEMPEPWCTSQGELHTEYRNNLRERGVFLSAKLKGKSHLIPDMEF